MFTPSVETLADMESNTSSSPASWTSTVAVLEHGEPSERAPSLPSPAFSSVPSSPNLPHASKSGSGSSWCQQIPPSPPAVGVGNGSLTVYAQATSSQSLPSSFPTLSMLPMVGYDLFGNPEVTVATPLPTLLRGQWEQEESSSRAPLVLPECPSLSLFGFASEFGAWPSKEMSSFFSPLSAGGLAPQSSDNLVGFLQPSSDTELAPLPQILRIPSLEVEQDPVDAPLPPIEEEEEKEQEIDVSAFLVSDLEDQLPNASWTATSPQMGGTGASGASASWMVPGSTGNNLPVMLAPAASSTCTMLSTSSGSTPCHSGSSSIGVASSIGGTMKPSPAVLPQMLPLSQGAGASSSNFNGFTQPSSSFVLAPLGPQNLQGPVLPVKPQEVMEYTDATTRRYPDFISLVDDDQDGLYEGAIPYSIPGPVLYPSMPESSSSRGSLLALGSASGLDGWARSSSGQNQKQSFALAAESRYNVFGSWGSPSFAPSSWGANSSSSSPSFAPSSWGANSSSFAVRTPCLDQSTSIDNYGSSSMPKLSIRGKMPSTSGLPPLPKLRARSRDGGAGIVFTDPEMAIIKKEKKLQELLRADPQKVKRILYNRAYSAVAKVRKVMRTKDLERLVVTLEKERRSLYAELQSLEEGSAALKAKKMEMEVIIGELEQQAMLKDAVREVLKAEIQKLNHLKLN